MSSTAWVFDSVPAHLELRVDPAEEVHALGPAVDPAFVTGAVEATELEGG